MVSTQNNYAAVVGLCSQKEEIGVDSTDVETRDQGLVTRRYYWKPEVVQ